MVCPVCREPNPGTNQYCYRCGASLAGAKPAAGGSPFEPIPPPPPPKGAKRPAKQRSDRPVKRRKKKRPAGASASGGRRGIRPAKGKSVSAHGVGPPVALPSGGRRPPSGYVSRTTGKSYITSPPGEASGPPGETAERRQKKKKRKGDPLAGFVIGRCRLVKLLGRGGMGYVYQARHLTLQIDVVVKILASDLTGNQKLIARFVREARSTAQLDHPNIVRIFDLGQEGGYFYIVMQFIEGENVQEILDRDYKLDWREAARIVANAATGLAYAHARGIIHRDIKPDNIMVSLENEVKVADFGLAKNVSGEVPITRSGSLLGTPHYMSPEQCQGVPTDERTDIYSLGITFYQLLTGELPYSGETFTAILYKQVHEPLPIDPPSHPDVPPEVWELLASMTDKERDERLRNAEEIVTRLEELLGFDIESSGRYRTMANAPRTFRDPRASSTRLPQVGTPKSGGTPASDGTPASTGRRVKPVIEFPKKTPAADAKPGSAAEAPGAAAPTAGATGSSTAETREANEGDRPAPDAAISEADTFVESREAPELRDAIASAEAREAAAAEAIESADTTDPEVAPPTGPAADVGSSSSTSSLPPLSDETDEFTPPQLARRAAEEEAKARSSAPKKRGFWRGIVDVFTGRRGDDEDVAGEAADGMPDLTPRVTPELAATADVDAPEPPAPAADPASELLAHDPDDVGAPASVEDSGIGRAVIRAAVDDLFGDDAPPTDAGDAAAPASAAPALHDIPTEKNPAVGADGRPRDAAPPAGPPPLTTPTPEHPATPGASPARDVPAVLSESTEALARELTADLPDLPFPPMARKPRTRRRTTPARPGGVAPWPEPTAGEPGRPGAPTPQPAAGPQGGPPAPRQTPVPAPPPARRTPPPSGERRAPVRPSGERPAAPPHRRTPVPPQAPPRGTPAPGSRPDRRTPAPDPRRTPASRPSHPLEPSQASYPGRAPAADVDDPHFRTEARSQPPPGYQPPSPAHAPTSSGPVKAAPPPTPPPGFLPPAGPPAGRATPRPAEVSPPPSTADTPPPGFLPPERQPADATAPGARIAPSSPAPSTAPSAPTPPDPDVARLDAGGAAASPASAPPSGLRPGADPDELINERDGASLLRVAGGEFTMGSADQDNERPVHRVVLEPYAIDRFPVTNARYRSFLEWVAENGDEELRHPDQPEDKSHDPDGWGEPAYERYSPGEEHPVVNVDWFDAYAYATWAGLRLPTEAEWERAARGDDGRRYPWGDFEPSEDPHGKYAQNKRSRSIGPHEYTAPVDAHPAGRSPVGCEDMAGNVNEWCEDGFHPTFYVRSPRKNPVNRAIKTPRSLRGGSWNNADVKLRTTARVGLPPLRRDPGVGFRCVVSLGAGARGPSDDGGTDVEGSGEMPGNAVTS